MLLAASSVAQARRLIDRGHASVGRLALRGGVVPNVHYMVTTDAARNVRASLFPPAGPLRSLGIEVKVEEGVLPAPGSPDVLLVQTGIARFQGAESLEWLPGLPGPTEKISDTLRGGKFFSFASFSAFSEDPATTRVPGDDASVRSFHGSSTPPRHSTPATRRPKAHAEDRRRIAR